MASDRSFQFSRWRTLLLQPTWLAGVISVGFHGALFAAGPTFSNLNLDTLADPDALADTRRVPLVELTLAEQQQHIPDFSNSFYSLSSLDDFETTIPRAPMPVPNSNLPSAGQPLRPRTTVTDQVNLGTTPSPYQYRLPGLPVPIGGNTEGNRPGAVTPNPSGATTSTASTPAAESTSAPETPIPGDPAASTASTATTAEPSAQDLALAPSNPAGETSADATGQRPDASQVPRFAYNSETLDEAWERWLAQGELSLAPHPLPLENLPLPYRPSQSACPRFDHRGLVAALVNAEGKLLEGSVQLLKSTGNDALDLWAQTDGIDAFKFPEATQQQTAYLLEVFVERAEICD